MAIARQNETKSPVSGGGELAEGACSSLFCSRWSDEEQQDTAHGHDGECVTAKGTSEPIGSNNLCGLQRHAWREGKRAHGESPAPMVELRVWLFFVAHFTHTQVRVCGTQQGIVRLGEWCVRAQLHRGQTLHTHHHVAMGQAHSLSFFSRWDPSM